MKTIATIKLDDNWRVNPIAKIIYKKGRIWCDGNDITSGPADIKISVDEARNDILSAYRHPDWELRFVNKE